MQTYHAYRLDLFRLIPRVLLCGPVGVLTTGCATFLHGSNQSVPVFSTPGGASVVVDGVERGATPCVLKLKRNRAHLLHFNKPGHLDVTYPLTRVSTDETLGNIWIGGLIGLTVDAATGANYKLVPESVRVTLPPDGHAPDPEPHDAILASP